MDHNGTYLNGHDLANLLALNVTCRQIRKESAEFVTHVTDFIIKPEFDKSIRGNDRICPNAAGEPLDLDHFYHRLNSYSRADPRRIKLYVGSVAVSQPAWDLEHVFRSFRWPSQNAQQSQPQLASLQIDMDIRVDIIADAAIHLTLRRDVQTSDIDEIKARKPMVKRVMLDEMSRFDSEEVRLVRRQLYLNLGAFETWCAEHLDDSAGDTRDFHLTAAKIDSINPALQKPTASLHDGVRSSDARQVLQ